MHFFPNNAWKVGNKGTALMKYQLWHVIRIEDIQIYSKTTNSSGWHWDSFTEKKNKIYFRCNKIESSWLFHKFSHILKKFSSEQRINFFVWYLIKKEFQSNFTIALLCGKRCLCVPSFEWWKPLPSSSLRSWIISKISESIIFFDRHGLLFLNVIFQIVDWIFLFEWDVYREFVPAWCLRSVVYKMSLCIKLWIVSWKVFFFISVRIAIYLSSI